MFLNENLNLSLNSVASSSPVIDKESILARLNVLADLVYKVDKKAGNLVKDSLLNVTSGAIGVQLKMPNILVAALGPIGAIFQAVKYRKLKTYYDEINELVRQYNAFAQAEILSDPDVGSIYENLEVNPDVLSILGGGGVAENSLIPGTGGGVGSFPTFPTLPTTTGEESKNNTLTIVLISVIAAMIIGAIIYYLNTKK